MIGARPTAERALRGPNQRGFALITVLWLITVLSAAVGLALAGTRMGALTTQNRVALARGRWAAEACLAIAQARWADGRRRDTATVDLGRMTRCGWRLEDPTARVNVNLADARILRHLLGDSLGAIVLEARRRRPVVDIEEMRALGVDSALAEVLTVDGPGSVNASAAPGIVLGALPGLTPEAVARIAYRRSVGRPLASLDELVGEVSPDARAALVAHYADLARSLTFAPPQLLLTASGWVGAAAPRPGGLHAEVELLVVPLPERLAVIRRRMR